MEPGMPSREGGPRKALTPAVMAVCASRLLSSRLARAPEPGNDRETGRRPSVSEGLY